MKEESCEDIDIPWYFIFVWKGIFCSSCYKETVKRNENTEDAEFRALYKI